MNVDTPIRSFEAEAPRRHGFGAYLACFPGHRVA